MKFEKFTPAQKDQLEESRAKDAGKKVNEGARYSHYDTERQKPEHRLEVTEGQIEEAKEAMAAELAENQEALEGQLRDLKSERDKAADEAYSVRKQAEGLLNSLPEGVQKDAESLSKLTVGSKYATELSRILKNVAESSPGGSGTQATAEGIIFLLQDPKITKLSELDDKIEDVTAKLDKIYAKTKI